MVAQATVQALKLYIAGIPATPIGHEDSLIACVRRRFNAKYLHSDRTSVLINIFVFGVRPLLNYLTACTSTSYVASQGRTAVGLRLYELFKVATARTRIPKRFAAVTDDDDCWAQVEAGVALLMKGNSGRAGSGRQRRGLTARMATSSHSGAALVVSPQCCHSSHHWRRRALLLHARLVLSGPRQVLLHPDDRHPAGFGLRVLRQGAQVSAVLVLAGGRCAHGAG